jgi:hypothetical protein
LVALVQLAAVARWDLVMGKRRNSKLRALISELEAIRVFDMYFLLGDTDSEMELMAYCARQRRKQEIHAQFYGEEEGTTEIEPALKPSGLRLGDQGEPLHRNRARPRRS